MRLTQSFLIERIPAFAFLLFFSVSQIAAQTPTINIALIARSQIFAT